MNCAIVGYGKMGHAIERVAAGRGHRVVIAARPLQARTLGGAEVAFEFTRPEAAAENVRALVAAGIAVVSGTTGWEPDAAFATATERSGAGIVLAPNFSVGVNLFFRIVERAADLLGRSELFDPWVQEFHHRDKRDAPSGTARRLAAAVLAGDRRHSIVVEGNPPGPMPGRAIHLSSLRAGDEPGTHLVGFDSSHERVVLEHRAKGRDGFALGAVLAGEWLRGRAGRHRFEDVLDDILAREKEGP